MAARDWLTTTWHDITRFDRSSILLASAVRDALLTVAPLVIGAATGNLNAGVMVSLGMVSVAPMARIGRNSRMTGWMLGAGLFMALSAFLGSTFADMNLIALLFVTITGFAGGMLVAFGPIEAQAGLAGVIMMIVTSHQPQPMRTALEVATLILLGAFLQTLVAAAPGRYRRVRPVSTADPDDVETPAPALRDLLTRVLLAMSWDAPAFRHAVRLALCLAIADSIARDPGIRHGYWIPMTAALVLRTEFAPTFTRVSARIAGTLAGLLLASILLHLNAASTARDIALFGLLVFLILGIGGANYVLLVLLITSLLFVMLTMIGALPAGTLNERGVDTALGGAIALGTFLLWHLLTRKRAGVEPRTDPDGHRRSPAADQM